MAERQQPERVLALAASQRGRQDSSPIAMTLGLVSIGAVLAEATLMRADTETVDSIARAAFAFAGSPHSWDELPEAVREWWRGAARQRVIEVDGASLAPPKLPAWFSWQGTNWTKRRGSLVAGATATAAVVTGAAAALL